MAETEDNQNRKCQENWKTANSSSKCTALPTLSNSSMLTKQTSESKDCLKHGKNRSDNVLEDSKLPMDGREMLKKEINIWALHTTSGIQKFIVKHSLLPISCSNYSKRTTGCIRQENRNERNPGLLTEATELQRALRLSHTARKTN